LPGRFYIGEFEVTDAPEAFLRYCRLAPNVA
jgi:hypothetical protein